MSGYHFATETGTSSGPSCSSSSTARLRARCAPSSRTACARPSATGALAAGARLPRLARARRRPRRLAAAGRRRLRAAARRGLPRRPRGAPARTSPRRRARRRAAPRRSAARAAAFDFFPGCPDLSAFPRARVAARAARGAARRARRRASATPTRAARRSCAARWPATCGACAASSPTPESIVVCAGVAQGFALLAARCSARARRIDVEDPGPAAAPRRSSRTAACELRGAARGRATAPRRGAAGARGARSAGAVLVTPAHQSPDGRRCSRRAARARSCAGRASGDALVDRGRLRRRVPLRPRAARRAAGARADRVVYLGIGQQDARARRCGSAGWSLPERAASSASCGEGARRPRHARRSTSSRSRGCSSAAPTTATCARRAGATAPAATRSWRGRRATCRAPASPASPPGCTRSCGSAAPVDALALAAAAAAQLASASTRSASPTSSRAGSDDGARPGLRQPARAGDRGGHPQARGRAGGPAKGR